MIINNLKVGYHLWIDNNSLLLFVLEDTVTNGLHYYNTKTKDAKCGDKAKAKDGKCGEGKCGDKKKATKDPK